ncbi:MAG: EAL domain-containing protein [Pseudomonadota bacterium]
MHELDSQVGMIEAFELSVVPVWVFDIDNACVHWANRAALALWKSDSLEELTHRDMASDMSPSVRQRLAQYQEDFQQGLTFYEQWTFFPDNEPRTYNCHMSGLLIDGERVALLCQATLKLEEDRPEILRGSQAMLLTSAMISLYDDQGAVLYTNPSARSMLGNRIRRLDQHIKNEEDLHEILEAVQQIGSYKTEKAVNTSTGLRWHEITVQSGPDTVTGKQVLLVSESDITDRRNAQEQAYHLAYHDQLTGLHNRAYLWEKLDEELKFARRYRHTLAVMYIDLDRFKTVNDTLGHALGDRLLVDASRRIQAALYETDLVSRIGGDEFVCIVRDIAHSGNAGEVARKIVAKFASPIWLDSNEIYITPSIGISLFPDDGSNGSSLLQHADLAMYEAKAKEGNGFEFFDTKIDKIAKEKLALEHDFRRGIAKQEFFLLFQPQVEIGTGKVIGVEALLRWNHPERGVLTPFDFLEVAETTGLIDEIDGWVMKAAAEQQSRLEKHGNLISMSVNVSARRFARKNLVEEIKNTLTNAQCNIANFHLEITESVYIGTEETTIEKLEALREAGFQLALDDFGTGYSNLAYLQKFPIDFLKIDQSFVRDTEKVEILDLIISMGKLLNTKIIAEGVETESQLTRLHERGCHAYQGYFFSKPVEENQLLELLRQEPSN